MSLADAVRFCKDGAPGPAALVLMTVEGLRLPGEHHSGPTVDKALKKLAPLFRTSIKKNDVVARIGPDEFAFLFDDVNADNAEAIAGRVRNSVEALEIALPDRAFAPQCLWTSVGIAVTASASSATDLFTQADLALKAVRAGGKTGLLLFSAAIGGNVAKSYGPHAA